MSTCFIVYTKGTQQWVTNPHNESKFLDWLATFDAIKDYTRVTSDKVCVQCSPITVHKTEKREAIILKLVKDT